MNVSIQVVCNSRDIHWVAIVWSLITPSNYSNVTCFYFNSIVLFDVLWLSDFACDL